MDLDRLASIHNREKNLDQPQQLEDSFYVEAAEFIQSLREQRDEVAASVSDPFTDPEVNQLTDTIQTAEDRLQTLYEQRVGKLVKMASFAAADFPAETDGFTTEEQELFEEIVEDIKSNRERVLSLASDDQPTTDVATTSDVADSADSADAPAGEDNLSAASMMGNTDTSPHSSAEDSPEIPSPSGDGSQDSESDSIDNTDTTQPTSDGKFADDPSPTTQTPANGDSLSATPVDHDTPDTTDSSEEQNTTQGIDRVDVQVTTNVGELFGADGREYDLHRGDVVSLPIANAEALVENEAATILE